VALAQSIIGAQSINSNEVMLLV